MIAAPDRPPFASASKSAASTAAPGRDPLALLEPLLIATLVVVYAASFGMQSPVNGLGRVHEVFDQDSRYILRALADGVSYPWNPQSHLFYHWLTDGAFGLWRRGFGGGMDSAFWFLKVFTAATGLAFLLALRMLLREVGLPLLQRLLLLPLAGLTLAVWFHSSAFETSGLTLPFSVLLMVAFLRRVRRRDESMANHALLVGALLFAFWTRSDQWRLPVAVGLTLLLPQTRAVRRGLVLDLALFGALLPLGLGLLASSYFHVPFVQVARKLVERHDRAELAPLLMTRKNLTPRDFVRVARANALYSFIMPIGEPRSPFSAKLRGLLHSPLSLLALLGVGGLLIVTAARSLRRLASGDAFHLLLWVTWILGSIFYTWFNPREPFLWIVQFGLLEIVALADTWSATRALSASVPLAVVAALVALHNAVFFWLPYR